MWDCDHLFRESSLVNRVRDGEVFVSLSTDLNFRPHPLSPLRRLVFTVRVTPLRIGPRTCPVHSSSTSATTVSDPLLGTTKSVTESCLRPRGPLTVVQHSPENGSYVYSSGPQVV